MTTNEQQTAIAKVCNDLFFKNANGVWCFMSPDLGLVEWNINDLNAMHEAEKVLSEEQKEQFVFWMNHIHPSADIHHSDGQKDFRLEVFSLVHAPASQRREAFLRTLNLWTESPTQPQ